MVSTGMAPTAYTFKPSRYSSHTILLQSLPEEGGGLRLLDVGCASGYLGDLLAGRGYHVVGIERPGLCGGDFPDTVELIEADLDQGLPRLQGPFSYILCADILEHLREPARLLGELRPLLVPGGRLVASLPNSGHLYFRLNVLVGRFPRHDRGLFDRTHLHFFRWDQWVDLLAGSGFQIESMRPTGTPVGLLFPRWSERLWVRALEAFAYGCAVAWRNLFGYQFVVVARPLDGAK